MANFTETFSEFLLDNQDSEVWQNIIQKFSLFPSFKVVRDNEEYSFNMYDNFVEEYADREIGAETEQKFCFQVNRQLNKSLIEFAPKIKSYLDSWDKLLLRKETLNATESNEYNDNSNGDALDYINPINGTTNKLSGKTSSTTSGNGTYESTKQYEVIYSLTGKSNITLIKDLMELKNIYLSCLESFKDLFMVIY